MTHTQACVQACDMAARIVADVRGSMTQSESDRYTAAIESCPAAHPWN